MIALAHLIDAVLFLASCAVTGGALYLVWAAIHGLLQKLGPRPRRSALDLDVLPDEPPVFESEERCWQALQQQASPKQPSSFSLPPSEPAPAGYVHSYLWINGRYVYRGLRPELAAAPFAPQPRTPRQPLTPVPVSAGEVF